MTSAKSLSFYSGQAPLCVNKFNTLRPRHDGRHFADAIFKCIFLNENISIAIKISLKFVPKVPINNIPALVQIMAWRLPGDKPLSEPMIVRLQMHICVIQPQWDKSVRSWTWWCSSLDMWFCYQLIAKPGTKTASTSMTWLIFSSFIE